MSIIKDVRDAFSRRDNAVTQYIILNVLVFAVLIILRASLFVAGHYAAFPNVMRQLALSAEPGVVLRHPWTLLTYAFTHEGPLHILFNMLNLYWFGRLIQEYLGSRRFVSLYILGALAGGGFFLLLYNTLPVFQANVAAGQYLVGASASVVAVIVAAATLLPDYTFMLFLFGAVRIKYIALFVVLVMSVSPIYEGNPGGGLAHLGGALLGFVFIKQMQAGRDLGRPVHAVGGWISRLFERRPPMQVTHRATSPGRPIAPRPATPAAEDVDAILDKISRSGYESLSKEEKQRLFRASQQ